MICLLVNYIMISFLPQKSVKTKNNNNNNNNKGERFVSLLFRTAIAYYVRTPFPLPSLLLQSLGTTHARVN